MAEFALEGVVPALATPFTADGELDEAALRRNVRALREAPLGGYLVLGSTGEFPHLSFEEKERAIAAVVEEAAGRPVIAQTGEPSTAATVRLTRRAAELGAQAALVVTPSYYKNALREREVAAFFRTVADASPIPVLVYNIPQTTGLNLSARQVAELAAHGNIAGIKDSAGDLAQIADLVQLAPPGFGVFTGADVLLPAARLLGARGAILASANVFPEALGRIDGLLRAGRAEEAAALHRRLLPALRRLNRLGIPGYKAGMDAAGFTGGAPRAPLLPLPEEERRALAEEVAQVLRALAV
ncbi:MAG: dihydrodipicolinate synthase family protein [Firmicutes bacterium]|nr:dihydrodipicolinate synthase family protein [Bacillota bacterium]